MKKIVLISIVGTICLFLHTGCSNITMLRIEELQQVEAHVDSLKSDLVKLQEQILQEQKQQSEMLRLMRADQQVRFAEFEREIKALAGNVSESQSRLSDIDQKTLEIKKRWEEKARGDSIAKVSNTVELENLFAIAHTDFTAGRYEIAINGLQELISKFPDSRQAEDAYYWMAECYYVQKKYEEAIKRYKQYLKDFPSGGKRCVTLYKLGMVYDAVNQQKASRMVLENLISQCPDSEEAQAAQAHLKRK